MTLLAMPCVVVQLARMVATAMKFPFLGQLGDETTLAGIGLGSSTVSCLIWCPLVGLNTCLDTVVSQSFGAGRHDCSAAALHRAAVVCCIGFLLLALLLGPGAYELLLLAGQAPSVARVAADYVAGALPATFAAAQIDGLGRFLTNQQRPRPVFVAALVSLPLHWLLCALCIGHLAIRRQLLSAVQGACLAEALTRWTTLLLLLLATHYGHLVPAGAWKPVQRSSFCWSSMRDHLRLAVPSAFMYAFELWIFEVMLFMAGYMDAASLAAFTLLNNMHLIVFALPLGVSSALSARVGSSAGRGAMEEVRRAVGVGFCLALVVLLVVLGIILACAYDLGLALSGNDNVAAVFAAGVPAYAVYALVDGVQGALRGAVGALGKQRAAAVSNFIAYYGVQLPAAAALCFSVHLGVPGIWLGAAAGAAVALLSYAVILRGADACCCCAAWAPSAAPLLLGATPACSAAGEGGSCEASTPSRLSAGFTSDAHVS
eukprot:TRINITY_DN14874_c3_g1_i1.p1 TRINITY_DN14874_c3_g1~~TRINITY_DN14874_c3_g1_i1.p1  ORF type:complete len:526 (+),score=103.06 TRINITY_DN14874_c3_g1_i1:118-1578(+)